jgi:hypothetical protein
MIEYLPLVLTGIGIIVSILYYASVLRNANKTQQLQLETRQTQLYMQAFQELNQEKRWKEYVDTRYFTEWENYADFQEKYGRGNPDFYAKLNSMWWIYNTIGMLIFEGFIDAKRVYGLMGPMGSLQWDKWKDVIFELRKELNMPSGYIGFEHLGNEMKRLEAEGYPTTLANKIGKTET